MKRRHSSVYDKPGKDEIKSQTAVFLKRAKCKRFGANIVQNNAAQQTYPTKNMDQYVPVSSINCLFFAFGENEICGSKSHQLPENEQSKVIAGKGDSKRSSDIEEGGDMLSIIFHMQCIHNTDKGHNGKYPAKNYAELIDRAKNKRVANETVGPVGSLGH